MGKSRAPRQVYDSTVVAREIDAQSSARAETLENATQEEQPVGIVDEGGVNETTVPYDPNIYPPPLEATLMLDCLEGPTSTKAAGLGAKGSFHDSSTVCDISLEEEDQVNSTGKAAEAARFSEIDKSKLHRRRCGKKTCFLLIFLSLFITVSLVVASVLFMRKRAYQQTVATQGLAPPPATLTATCSRSDIQRNQNLYLQCEELCQPAECCDYPATLDLSCLQGNEDRCLDYHLDCGNLLAPTSTSNNSIVVVPNVSADIDQVCSLTNLLNVTGLRNCYDVCSPYECCWKQGVPSCTDNPNCAYYSSCLHLAAVSTQSLSIVHHVAKICSAASLASSTGLSKCNTACQLAQCCFDTNIGKCPLSSMDASFCTQYAACKNMNSTA